MTLKLGIRTRSIKKLDIPSVKKMMEELSLYHGDRNKISAKQILDGCFVSKIDRGFIVEYKSKLVGFSMGYDWMNYVRGKRVHYIQLFFIKEKYRSMGLGQELLKHVRLSAQKRECDLIYVTSTKENRHADQFYKEFGFKRQVKRAPNKYILKI